MQMTNKSMASQEEGDPRKQLNRQISTRNLNSLNGSDFWKDWERAGGDPDEYVKETLPTYGIIGALLLTVSIPLTLSPISFAFSNPSDDITNATPFVRAYSICLNLSTALSLVLIILPMGVYQQYVNAYSKALRLGFVMRFGYLVSIFTTALILDILSLLAAVFIGIAEVYDTVSAVIGIFFVVVATVGSFVVYTNITVENSNTYSASMREDIRAREEIEAQLESSNGNTGALSNQLIEKLSDHEKLVYASKEMEKLFRLFSRSFQDVVEKEKELKMV